MFPSFSAMFSTLRKTFTSIKRVPFFVWLFLANAFFLVNAGAIAPAEDVPRFQITMIVYMLLTTAFMGLAPRAKWMKATLNQGIAWFAGGLMVIVVVGAIIRNLPAVLHTMEFGPMQLTGPLYLTAVHALVIATNETWIFQGFLPLTIGVVFSQIFFGFMHWQAYAGNPLSILTAIIMGFVFYFIAMRFNIWLAIGVHAGINLSLLAVFGGIGGGAAAVALGVI